jgi:hypothetical protein
MDVADAPQSLRPYRAMYASAGGQHCVLLAKLAKDDNAMDMVT